MSWAEIAGRSRSLSRSCSVRFLFLWHINLRGLISSHPCWRTAVIPSTHCLGYKGFHAFPLGTCPSVNVTARLEFELAYYDVVVKHVSHCTTGTLCLQLVWIQFYFFETSRYSMVKELRLPDYFPKCISILGNAYNFVQNSNSSSRVNFIRW